jgi:hypothetical protein
MDHRKTKKSIKCANSNCKRIITDPTQGQDYCSFKCKCEDLGILDYYEKRMGKMNLDAFYLWIEQ